MKNVYRWLAGWMAALCLLTALAVPVSAEGFDYTWDQDTCLLYTSDAADE